VSKDACKDEILVGDVSTETPLFADVPDWELRRSNPYPKTRQDCLPGGINEERPCAFLSCRHHLGIEFRNGKVVELEGWENRPYSCVLDATDDGEMKLEEIGDVLGVSRERIRQMLAKMERRIKAFLIARGLKP
jgi:hypothetical protein